MWTRIPQLPVFFAHVIRHTPLSVRIDCLPFWVTRLSASVASVQEVCITRRSPGKWLSFPAIKGSLGRFFLAPLFYGEHWNASPSYQYKALRLCIYSLCIWCVSGAVYMYDMYIVYISASLGKWSEHHSVPMGKLSLVSYMFGTQETRLKYFQVCF